MRLLSKESAQVAKDVYKSHGNSWKAVKSAGTVRDDGVVVVKTISSKPAERTPQDHQLKK